METLLDKSNRILRAVASEKRRYLFDKILWNNRLVGIKGSRGVGKSTLMLQKLKDLDLPPNQASYWTLDDLFFTDNSLAKTAGQFYKEGGRVLFLDEVHKYPKWSQHIKNLYDEYVDLQIVFTGSSIIDILREEADLSRRALMYSLAGMSYREYLNFKYNIKLPVISLSEIVDKSRGWQNRLPVAFRPLEYFKEYLIQGYYPISLEDSEGFSSRLQLVIRIIVESDMASVKEFDVKNAQKLLQLLYILSVNAPFNPNISELARKSGIPRNYIMKYLYFLEQAQLIRRGFPAGIMISNLERPDKIFLNNTNLAYALASDTTNKGSLRETFFASQLSVNHKVTLPKQGDFIIDDKYVFEIGGKTKKSKQIKDIPDAYVVTSDQDFPASKIPLWLFGLMY